MEKGGLEDVRPLNYSNRKPAHKQQPKKLRQGQSPRAVLPLQD